MRISMAMVASLFAILGRNEWISPGTLGSL